MRKQVSGRIWPGTASTRDSDLVETLADIMIYQMQVGKMCGERHGGG